MANAMKLTREQLGVQKEDMIVIEGFVSYARVDKLIEGEALVQESKRRESLGMIKTDTPFRTITITEPKVIKGDQSPLAQFHGQNVYVDKNGKKAMSLESKSKFPPKYGHIQNGVLVEMADPMKNPATGQKVLLFIQAYGSKSYSKIGSSFNAIVFPEGEIKYYEGGNGNGLSGFGQALNLPVQNMVGQAPEPANLLGEQPTNGSTQPAQPAQPAQPVVNGFDTAAIQPTQPVTQPEQPTQPLDQQFAGFGQTPPQPQTAGRSDNPFA